MNCPHCLRQVQMVRNASTGQEVGKCPVHGDILKALLVKNR